MRRSVGIAWRAIAAVAVGAGAGVATVAAAGDRPVLHVAVAEAAVRPVTSGSDEPDSSFFQTLGRGLVVETYAEVVRRRAGGVLGAADPNVRVSIVAETTIVRVEARGPTRADAVDRAGEIVEDATDFVNQLGQPYELAVLEPGAALPDAVDGGRSVRTAAAVAAVCAALLGYRLLRLVGRRSR